MQFRLFGRSFRIKFPWDKEPVATQTYSNGLGWEYLKGEPSYGIEGMVEAMKELRKQTGKMANQMWINQSDKDFLKSIFPPAEPAYVSPLFGIEVYVSEAIPNNMVKVIANDGTVSWIKLREDNDEKESREVPTHN